MEKLFQFVVVIMVFGLCGAYNPVRRNIRRFPVLEPEPNWLEMGQEELREALKVQPNTNVAKNVILFIGDGMGFANVWASRVYKGQYKDGVSGEEGQLEFEKLPYAAISRIYSVDYQIPASAATATAILSGQKNRVFVLGLDQSVHRANCTDINQHKITTMLDWSIEAGKWTGVISTARITHATPAASYAHIPERYWEDDRDLMNPDKLGPGIGCTDIASQLIDDNSDIHVILGGGRAKFLSNMTVDPEYPSINGTRTDGRDLITDWESMQLSKGRSYKYVWNKTEFDQVDHNTNDYLLGLFEPSHMQYNIDRDPTMEPSLAELTEKAIHTLKRGPNGFFLFVEGARIDHAHHEGVARKALEDTWALSEAVKRARELINSDDTLIVVTADHGLAFTSQGYPSRGNDIMGLVDTDRYTAPSSDGMPYLTLTYANSPDGLNFTTRADITNDNTTDKNYKQQALWRTSMSTHSGEDVPIFAEGPMAHLFHSTHEQNYIAHVMGYAACVGPNTDHCTPEPTASGHDRMETYTVYTISLSLLMLLWK